MDGLVNGSSSGATAGETRAEPVISVLVVDDHTVLADALQVRLSGEPDLRPVMVAYGTAHAWATRGHVLAAEQLLDDQALEHRLRSQV